MLSYLSLRSPIQLLFSQNLSLSRKPSLRTSSSLNSSLPIFLHPIPLQLLAQSPDFSICTTLTLP